MAESIITHDEADEIVQRLPDQDDRSDITLADYVRQQRERESHLSARVDCGWSHDRDGRCGECVACLRAEIDRLTRELAEERVLVRSLQDHFHAIDAGELQRKYEEHLTEMDELVSERDAARQELAEANAECAAMRTEYVRMRSALTVAESDNAALREMAPSSRERFAIERVCDQWIPWHAQERDEAPIREWLSRLSPPSAPAHRGDVDYTCEFCGCKTNARLRACCEKGHAADIRKAPAQDKENDHG